jgi:hypothetical protein
METAFKNKMHVSTQTYLKQKIIISAWKKRKEM